MKKYLFSIIFLLVSYVGFSQKGLSYQAVILDPTPIEIPGQDIAGQPLVNGDVWLKFSIYTGTLMQFEEVQKTKTDGYGLVNLLIGSVASASFNSLTWDGVQKSMQVFVSFNQGTSYTKVSDQKLYYNPYALYAETAGKLGSILAIADGGTGATTAADARANLGLGNVDNTSDAAKPISTATKAALDFKANVADMNAALNLKATVAALEAHMAITADTTMLATKAALTDLNNYAPKASPTFTGTVSGINKSMVGLASVDNTSDEAKPISIATQTALDLKLNTVDATTALALKANATTVTASLNLKENTANKSTNVVTDGSSDTKYPSVKSVKNYVDAQVASGIGSATISDADAITKGKIQLAGDLSGTAAAPTVPGLVLKANANDVTSALELKANIASPTFTGTVTTGAISATSVSASLYSSQPKTLEYSGTTITWNPEQGLNAAITLTANSTLAFTSTPPAGSYGTIVLTQDGTGSRTITLPSIAGVTNKILGSTSTSTVELSTAANAKDILNFYYDGIECYWNIGQGYGAAAASTQPPITLTTTGTGLATLSGAALNIPDNSFNGGTINNALVVSSGSYGQPLLLENSDTWQTVFGLSNLSASKKWEFGVGGSSNSALGVGKFGIYESNGGYRFAITPGGNVQIGTTSDSGFKLDVQGSTRTTGALTTGDITFPTTHGSNGQVLSTTGSGTLGWATPVSGIPYTGATSAVNLGAYNLTVNDVSVGRGAGNQATNTSIGNGALSSNTNGGFNTALGNGALQINTSGAFNTSVGTNALLYNNGDQNIAIGSAALQNNSTGSLNSAVGFTSNYNNQSGNANTSFGYNSLSINTTGSNNTAIGAESNVATTNLSNATAIGYQANVAASNSIQLGNTNVNNVKTSGTLTAGAVTYPNVHGSANQVLTTSGSGTLGWSTPITSLTTTGSGSATISGTTLNIPAGIPYSGATGSVDFGAYDVKVNGLTIGIGAGTLSNTVMGNSALASNTTGNNNNALGYNALLYNTTGSNNNAIGSNSLVNNTTGNNNNALGYYALNRNSTGINNTAVGQSALEKNTSGSNNNAFGFYSLNSNSTGWYNTGFGGNTLYGNTTGRYNTAIGRWALYHNLTGNHNTAIGNYAGVAPGSSNLENTTAIGDSALVTTSNTIQLGNPSVTNVKTAGNITAGSVIYPNAHNSTAGQVLTINASGTATWTTPTSGSSSTHSIGEVYGGGIVFYVWDGGAHGLIAASANLTGKYWGADGTLVSSTTYPLRDGIGAGRNNTERIIQNIKSSDNIYKSDYTLYAAYVCLTFQDGNYGDWYLPSKYELSLLYLQKTLLSMSGMYWASNDGGTRDAWCHNFDAGTTYLNTKNYFQMNVRPIRSF